MMDEEVAVSFCLLIYGPLLGWYGSTMGLGFTVLF